MDEIFPCLGNRNKGREVGQNLTIVDLEYNQRLMGSVGKDLSKRPDTLSSSWSNGDYLQSVNPHEGRNLRTFLALVLLWCEHFATNI